MAPIEKVYVSCYKNDAWLARLCVASIRYWYPDLPITLIKDYCGGSFSTYDLETYYGVKIADTSRLLRNFGRLEICFQEQRERFLYLDADTVIAGRVIEVLETSDADFIVHPHYMPRTDVPAFTAHYYHLDRIHRDLDATFRYPGFVFNSGQFVGTSGILKRSDFSPCISWSESPPRNRIPHIVSLNDQGPLNYVLPKLAQEDRLSIGMLDFKRGGEDLRVQPGWSVDIQSGQGHPYVIHWMGTKASRLSGFPNRQILDFYASIFCKHSSTSSIRYSIKRLGEVISQQTRSTTRQVYSWLPTTIKNIHRSIRKRRL
jgi:hypothetical protein